MIKRIVAYTDSEGGFHPSREAACKAEFRRLLMDLFGGFEGKVQDLREAGPVEITDPAIRVDDLVEALFDLDKICGDACKEDTTVQYAPPR